MKISYKFVNEAMDIEIDEKWGNVLLDLNRQEYNNNQTETRRHASLSAMDYDGKVFIDPNAEIESLVELSEAQEALRRAIHSLLPQQKALLKKVLFEGISAAEIARQEGVNKSSVHKRLQRIFEQLKNVLQ